VLCRGNLPGPGSTLRRGRRLSVRAEKLWLKSGVGGLSVASSKNQTFQVGISSKAFSLGLAQKLQRYHLPDDLSDTR